jgi:hypothetical protein
VELRQLVREVLIGHLVRRGDDAEWVEERWMKVVGWQTYLASIRHTDTDLKKGKKMSSEQ